MKRKELKAVRDSQEFVRLVRTKPLSAVEGYVVAVGAEWTVVLSMMSAVYNGHVILRNADLRKVREPFAKPKRVKTALKSGEMWPPTSPELLDLDTTRALLWTAGSLCPLLSIAKEHSAVESACSVDAITERQAKTTSYDGRSLTVRLADVTKVVLWDPHVERLRLNPVVL